MAPDSGRPVILFDGVCNLCTTSVKWVIANDPAGVFKFASLQSQAAEGLLGGKKVGDSIVLVDDDGIHGCSDAVIRIARRLRRPWLVAKLGPLLPRPIRDWIYHVIARNRYGWFGKQDSCLVPTPELRMRFLDRHEPPFQPEPSPAEHPSAGKRPFYSFFSALGFYYLCLLVFPFPLTQLSFQIEEWVDKMKSPAIIWFGRAAFGLKITILPNGSGDTTYNYVEVVFDLAVAVVLALVTVMIMRARPISPKAWDRMRVYARYYMAAVMLIYGVDKLFLQQFPDPGPARLLSSYGSSSPMALLWTFMGASHPYQFFGGLAEVVGGILLFWRRTTLLGALICFAVLTNVAMMNYCYDVPVKIFSTHLVAISLFLAWPWLPRVVNLLLLHMPAPLASLNPYPITHPRLRLAVLAVKLLVILVLIGAPIREVLVDIPSMMKAMRKGPPSVSGIYSALPADLKNNEAAKWARVGIESYGYAKVLLSTGDSMDVRLDFDEKGGVATIQSGNQKTPTSVRYTQSATGLRLYGKTMDVTLKKLPPGQILLTSRGFHWINEFPYAR